MTIPRARHIREKLPKDSALLCGGGRALDPEELPSVPLKQWTAAKNDCGRCLNVMHARKERE